MRAIDLHNSDLSISYVLLGWSFQLLYSRFWLLLITISYTWDKIQILLVDGIFYKTWIKFMVTNSTIAKIEVVSAWHNYNINIYGMMLKQQPWRMWITIRTPLKHKCQTASRQNEMLVASCQLPELTVRIIIVHNLIWEKGQYAAAFLKHWISYFKEYTQSGTILWSCQRCVFTVFATDHKYVYDTQNKIICTMSIVVIQLLLGC